MSEAVEILIDAEDRASGKLAKVAESVDDKVKRIRDVGGKAKASTEFVGTLSRSLGGTELANYAGGLAQLTERVSAFSEVSKAGGAGALAFKGGLVAVAAVVGSQIGFAIGNLVFETSRWTKQLQEANALLHSSADELARIESIKLSFRSERADLLGEAESRKLLNQLTEEAFAIEKEIEKTKAEQLKDAEGIVGWARYLTGQSATFIEANKAELATSEKKLDAIKREKDALTARLSPYRAEIEAIKKANEEKKKAAEDEKRNAERLDAIKKNELAKLEEQRIALDEGREAAKAFALEQQGLDKATAANIAKEQEAIDIRKAKQQFNKPDLQAVESRLLTRGKVDTGIDKVAKNTADAVNELKLIREKLPLTSSESLKLEFVS